MTTGVTVLSDVLLQVLFAYTVGRWAVGAAVVIVAIVAGARKVHAGWSVREARSRARASVDTPAKLRAAAPVAAGMVALVSFFAVILALVAAPSHASSVHLPPAADARLQLWIIAVAIVAGSVALDCWFGFGTCARGLTDGGFTAAIVAATVALDATSPLLILARDTSRPTWLTLIVVQFVWPFAAPIMCSAVSARRKKTLHVLKSGWLAASSFS